MIKKSKVTQIVKDAAKEYNLSLESFSTKSGSQYFILRSDSRTRIKFRISDHNNDRSKNMHNLLLFKSTKLEKVERFAKNMCEKLRIKSRLESLNNIANGKADIKTTFYIRNKLGEYFYIRVIKDTPTVLFSTDKRISYIYDSVADASMAISKYNLEECTIEDIFGTKQKYEKTNEVLNETENN